MIFLFSDYYSINIVNSEYYFYLMSFGIDCGKHFFKNRIIFCFLGIKK